MFDIPSASGATSRRAGGVGMMVGSLLRASLLVALAGALHGCATGAPPKQRIADSYTRPSPVPAVAPLFAPRTYEARRFVVAPAIDGQLDSAWADHPWSDPFLDIEGPARAEPSQRTRVKMGWDDRALYILAELEETDLWATLTEHDAIVFHDNDFEVFVDPDADTREYYEIEVNAIGTVFDLFLPRPYRAEGKADHSWTAEGMELAISLDGTLNDPRDRDRAWRVEMALPWTLFAPPKGHEPVLQSASRPPRVGDAWRINFSRVQWALERTASGYAKVPGRPEDNWTWTPQWTIDMHLPQWWGVVKFVERAP